MKKISIEIKWSIIFIIVSILWIALAKPFKMFDTNIEYFPTYAMFFFVPAIILFILALRDKKQNFYNGQMNFRQGFISGIIISIIVTLFTPLSQYIIHIYICPEFFSNMIANQVTTGQMDKATAENFFTLKSYIVQSVFASIVSGIITSLIVAFIVKSKK
jgi:hypothetical protein